MINIRIMSWCIFVVVVALVSSVDAEYDLSRYMIDGGGGTSSGGNYTLTGTIGQYDAAYSQAGDYEILGGFWPGELPCSTNNPPVASPSATPASGTAPLNVQFTANASDPDGDTLTYDWDFGDGEFSTEQDPNHTFINSGTYDVWLTVSDGEFDVSAPLIIAVELPIALYVERACVDWYGNKNSLGKIRIIADVTPYEPWPDEIISVSYDGIILFAVPFSMFEQSTDDPDMFVYNAKHIFVKLNYTDGTLDVFRRKVDLFGLNNNTYSAVVELHIADAVAVETIVMSEHPGRKLVYKRQD